MGSPELSDTEATTDDNAPLTPAFKIAIAGIIVTNIPKQLSYLLNRKPSVFISLPNRFRCHCPAKIG